MRFFRDEPLIETMATNLMTSDPCQLKLTIEGSELAAGMTSAQLTLTLSPCNNRHRQRQCQVMTTFAPVYASILPLWTLVGPLWDILRHFETFQVWATWSKFEQFWAVFRASLGHFEQFWTCLSGKFGSCRVILNNFWKHDMTLLTLDNVQNVSIEAALRHLTLAEKDRWCKPHRSRP